MIPKIVQWLLVAMLFSVSEAAAQSARDTAEHPSESWITIRETLFGDRPIADGSIPIELEAPYRAHDAAAVPIAVRITPGNGRRVVRLVLIVDENPSPVAAEIELGPGMAAEAEISTRLRIDAYSNVRVVAELDDGTLHQAARFVKASGGCAAPALKDPAAALTALGRVKIRHFELPRSNADRRREVQVMIRHPNNSGFQKNQVTQLYIPAFFVDTIEVFEGDDRLLRLSGGISLSENPSLRFFYNSNGSGKLKVLATDIDGGRYEGTAAVTPDS